MTHYKIDVRNEDEHIATLLTLGNVFAPQSGTLQNHVHLALHCSTHLFFVHIRDGEGGPAVQHIARAVANDDALTTDIGSDEGDDFYPYEVQAPGATRTKMIAGDPRQWTKALSGVANLEPLIADLRDLTLDSSVFDACDDRRTARIKLGDVAYKLFFQDDDARFRVAPVAQQYVAAAQAGTKLGKRDRSALLSTPQKSVPSGISPRPFLPSSSRPASSPASEEQFYRKLEVERSEQQALQAELAKARETLAEKEEELLLIQQSAKAQEALHQGQLQSVRAGTKAQAEVDIQQALAKSERGIRELTDKLQQATEQERVAQRKLLELQQAGALLAEEQSAKLREDERQAAQVLSQRLAEQREAHVAAMEALQQKKQDEIDAHAAKLLELQQAGNLLAEEQSAKLQENERQAARVLSQRLAEQREVYVALQQEKQDEIDALAAQLEKIKEDGALLAEEQSAQRREDEIQAAQRLEQRLADQREVYVAEIKKVKALQQERQDEIDALAAEVEKLSVANTRAEGHAAHLRDALDVAYPWDARRPPLYIPQSTTKKRDAFADASADDVAPWAQKRARQGMGPTELQERAGAAEGGGGAGQVGDVEQSEEEDESSSSEE